MRLGFRLKHHFFSAFREFFVHHHGSLEFRAKIFALLIVANEKPPVESYIVVKDIGMNIYNGDEERSDLLMISTKELIQKAKENRLDIDSLVQSILKELKIVPRYAKKIDIKALKPLVLLSHDADTIAYQENILEFLQTTKDEILNT
ncbi:MAG: hypothetical protein Q9M34_03925 [Sulfurimonas sp.]|nr:hypothetical protein [Sulfurimonas sp.]